MARTERSVEDRRRRQAGGDPPELLRTISGLNAAIGNAQAEVRVLKDAASDMRIAAEMMAKYQTPQGPVGTATLTRQDMVSAIEEAVRTVTTEIVSGFHQALGVDRDGTIKVKIDNVDEFKPTAAERRSGDY